jgi:superfamily I DNA/RNA helicase
MVPSKYQEAVYQAVQSGTPAIVVSAVAGSGKTTTLTGLLEYIDPRKSVLYLTFGKDANLALDAKINKQVLELLRAGKPTVPVMSCKTVHSLGNAALFSAGIKGDPTRGSNKYMRLCREYVDTEGNTLRYAGKQAASKYTYQLAQNMRKLVDMTRLTLSPPTDENLRQLISRFEIDILPEDEDIWPFVLEVMPKVLQFGIDNARRFGDIDFTDMIWLPSSQAMDLQPQKYDVVLVDEAQDLSPCQRELALRACKSNGQKIFVGDRNQSIFGFAGASLRSIDEIIEATGAIELPLSICYRCPKSVIQEAKRVGPDYQQIEAAETAADGTLEYTTPDTVSGMVQSGDLILCRLTAPLVSKCLELLRDGKRANVRGRDLGAQFSAMIEQIQKFANVPEAELLFRLSEIVRDYERRQIEIMSLNLDENEMKIASLEDKVDTLLALYEAYVGKENGRSSLKGFQSYISDFFKEDPGAQIILSTGHRAKGLEYPRVFILDYDKLPHPRAKTKEALKQEYNLQYVMVTRAQQALFLVVARIPEPIEAPTLFDEPALQPELIDIESLLAEYALKVTPVEAPVATPRRPGSGRTPGADGPTKKKDFRFPIRLLEALKAVADEEGSSDTQIIVELLKGDPRIQRKLYADTHDTAEFFAE